MSKNEKPKLVDICKKLVTTDYNDLEYNEKIALCNFLMIHADHCDDPGFYGDKDEFDDTGFENVELKQTSYDDDDAMANTIKFIFNGYAYTFDFLSATNWEEDLSKLIGWDYFIEPVKVTKLTLPKEDIKILKDVIDIIENKEIEVADIKELMKVLQLTSKNKIIEQFINWAVKNNKEYFFDYNTPDEAIEDFEKSIK